MLVCHPNTAHFRAPLSLNPGIKQEFLESPSGVVTTALLELGFLWRYLGAWCFWFDGCKIILEYRYGVGGGPSSCVKNVTGIEIDSILSSFPVSTKHPPITCSRTQNFESALAFRIILFFTYG